MKSTIVRRITNMLLMSCLSYAVICCSPPRPKTLIGTWQTQYDSSLGRVLDELTFNTDGTYVLRTDWALGQQRLNMFGAYKQAGNSLTRTVARVKIDYRGPKGHYDEVSMASDLGKSMRHGTLTWIDSDHFTLESAGRKDRYSRVR